MNKLACRIIEEIDVNPTTIVNLVDGGVGIAWNTVDFYCDVEIYKNEVVFTLSKDRKHLEFITTDHDSIEYGIIKLKQIINLSLDILPN